MANSKLCTFILVVLVILGCAVNWPLLLRAAVVINALYILCLVGYQLKGVIKHGR